MVTQNSSKNGRRSWPAVALGLVGLVLVAAGWRPSASPAAELPTRGIVVTTHAVEAGQLLQASDVEVLRVSETAALASFLRDAGQAVGRRARVVLPAGEPLSGALLADAPTLTPGDRRLRLRLDVAAIPPGLQADDVVDIMAAVVGGDGSAGGRVVLVASGRVVTLEASRDASAGPSGGPTADLTLDVAARAASRVLWAEAFAKSLRLVGRPNGDGTPLSDAAELSP